MSRTRFPRVAARTRPKPPKSVIVKLPPLYSSLFKDGKLVGISEQPDPRTSFCDAMGRNYGDLGYSAKPITTKRQLAAARRAQATSDRIGRSSGKAVSQ